VADRRAGRAPQGGKGRTFESWKAVEDELNADYERLKQENPKWAGNLENERKRAFTDLRGLKNRLLHQIDPDADRDGWIMWLQRKMREFNFIRFGATMQVSVIPDLGAAALHHRVIPMIARYGKDAFQQIRRSRRTPTSSVCSTPPSWRCTAACCRAASTIRTS